MPKAKSFSLSGMLDTDAQDEAIDDETLPTPDSNQENKLVKKKGGRPKANAKRFTKPKRLSGGSVATKPTAAKKPNVGRKKAPLGEQTNIQQANGAEEVDEIAQSANDGVVNKGAESRPGAKRKGTGKQGERPAKAQATKRRVCATEKDGEFEYTPTAIRHNKDDKDIHACKVNGRRQPRSVSIEIGQVIPETQAPANAYTSGTPQEEDREQEPHPQSVIRRSNNARATSRLRQPNIVRRRAGSASDAESRSADPALRRRLGDMTRKFESVDLRYRDLKEVGIKEAEANYDKLKKQSEVNAKAANDLIASLKKEIATQKSIAHEVQSFQSQVQSAEADLSKTRALADQLSRSLSDAQNENKVLQAKLANSRRASVAVDKTPGSAMRNRNQGQTRTAIGGNFEIAQLKEDLYSDLSGLILRGVDIGDEADTFDCIQTGRNGTLHFKLAVAKGSEGSYENTEVQYAPRLDSNRDRALIELLPEYLTDEITFSRTNAAMFYGRVLETLAKRRTEETPD